MQIRVRSKLHTCSLLTMTRRTVLGRIWDRQQDRSASEAETFVRGESHEQNLHVVRNATDARGESVSSTAPGPEPRRDRSAVSPDALESAATRARGESVRGGRDETRRRGESTG